MVEILVGSSWLSEHPDQRDEPETLWNVNIVANLHQPTPLKGYRRVDELIKQKQKAKYCHDHTAKILLVRDKLDRK